MVTLAQLQAQKKRILDKRADAAKKQKLQFEKIELEKEIKLLQRSPSTSRNIILAQRTGRGLKIIGKKVGAAALRQFKRIQQQQQRDEVAFRKMSKNKKKLKTGQKLSKIKEKKGFDVFSNLDF